MNSADKIILGARLKLARKMTGISLQVLSDKLNNLVSKQALNKYEQGLMKPSSDVILALSKALEVKPDYFLRKNFIKPKNLSFRKKLSLSKKTEESILEKAKDYVERFLEVEDILGIDSSFNNPVNDLFINKIDDIDKASLKLREVWELGINPIPNLIEMLELNGIKVYLIDEVDEIDGVSFFASENIPVIIVNTRNKPIERIRFTVIHELAHLLLNLSAEIQNDKKLIEYYCHRFSSCFLLPSQKLTQMIGGKHRSYIAIKELINIKQYFGISIRAVVHRLHSMKIITDSYYKRWMIYLSKTYGQKKEPGEYIGQENTTLFAKLINRALSEDIISMSKAAALLNTNVNEIRKGKLGAK